MDLNPVAVTYTIYKLQLVISYSSSFWFVRYWWIRVVRAAFDLLDIGGLGLIALLICFFWSRCSVSAVQGTNRGKKWQQLPLFGVRILACKFNFLIFCLSMKIVRRENFNLFYKFAVIKKRQSYSKVNMQRTLLLVLCGAKSQEWGKKPGMEGLVL